MTIDNNLNSMMTSELKINDMATNIAKISVTNPNLDTNIQNQNPQNQEVSADLIDSIVGQIPEVISYSANAKSIETQNAVSDSLLNIKA